MTHNIRQAHDVIRPSDAFSGFEHSMEWRTRFFTEQEALGVALDLLVSLEKELSAIRSQQDAIPTPEHIAARRFLVERRRRNASVHG